MTISTTWKRTKEILLPGNWEIAGYIGDPARAHEIIATNHPRFVLEGPMGKYWADPMIFRYDGRTAVLFEEYVHSEQTAYIVAQELNERGEKIGVARRVTSDPWHMSFPHCVEIHGELYLVPESIQRGAVIAYRCKSFPFDWEPHIVLLERMNGADPTLHLEGDVVYLTMSEHGGGGPDNRGRLSVFWCAAEAFPNAIWHRVPTGQGTRGRNAGPLFRSQGQLIRPAQLSIDSYGEKVSLREVTLLSREGYDEREVAMVEPVSRRFSHYHTLSSAGDLFVIDRKRIGLGPVVKAQAGRVQRAVASMRFASRFGL